MKLLLNFVLIFIISVSNLSAQTWTCVEVSNLGLYQRDYPSLATPSIVAEGGSSDLTYSYDSDIRLWTFNFKPHEEKDYTIRYKEKFLGITLTNDEIGSYNVYRTNLILNSAVTQSSYVAKASSIITLSTGFSVSSTTTTFTTQLTNCSGLRIATSLGDEQPVILSESTPSETVNLKSYPNPFSNELTVEYQLLEESPVSITLSNSLGSQVFRYDLTSKPPGKYSEIINTENYSNGVYILRFRTKKENQKIKLIK